MARRATALGRRHPRTRRASEFTASGEDLEGSRVQVLRVQGVGCRRWVKGVGCRVSETGVGCWGSNLKGLAEQLGGGQRPREGPEVERHLRREMGNLLPNNRRQRRTCYALCHLLYPVSAAQTSIFRMDSNSTSYATCVQGYLAQKKQPP
jgi:hypothetical protein